jgi:hypothetical protein
MARGKISVESIDEQIRKLEERKRQLLEGGMNKAEQRAAFMKAVTHEFPDLDFAQMAGVLQAAYNRMPIPAEQLEMLGKNGMEILKKHTAQKRGNAEAPAAPASTAEAVAPTGPVGPSSGPVPGPSTNHGFPVGPQS